MTSTFELRMAQQVIEMIGEHFDGYVKLLSLDRKILYGLLKTADYILV